MLGYFKWICVVLTACAFCLAVPMMADAKKPDKPPKPPPDGGGEAEILFGPYLQNASPDSIVVMWKATADADSLVEYGTDQGLGQTEDSLAPIAYGEDFVHEVMLSNLSPDSVYHYKVKTGTAESAIYYFRTLPAIGSGVPLRIAVYSDVQKNKSSPNKHAEIVNDGIMAHITGTLGEDIAEGLDLVLVAGDLVDKGYSEKDWNTYFAEMANLGYHVPYLTVTGNHEYDNSRYFKLFSLPENSDSGFEEHYYSVDMGNVRIIGLDSNTDYRTASQISWLADRLSEANASADIDAVLVFMHHSYHNEMWLEGDTDWALDVIEELEIFSALNQKPSLLLTGHTHGYSRGQSLIAPVSMMTVASGEGGLDYWGDYENFDYPEFEMSMPEWGFMIIEVDDVGVHVQRLSRGNDVVFKNNDVVDEFTLLFNNALPATPASLIASPTGTSGEMLLSASAFSDMDPVNAISYCGVLDGHIESQFQVATDSGFNNILADQWLRFENLYSPPGARGERDGYYSEVACVPDMTEAIVGGLPLGQQLYFQVRYRDDSLGWSDWSLPGGFIAE
jgi:predicted MPP superfamily phosphohydrolase